MLQNLKIYYYFLYSIFFFCTIIEELSSYYIGKSLLPAKNRKKIMANIKSSKKRILIAEKNAEKNTAFKSSIKTALKKALELGKGTDKDALNLAVARVYQLCDKAVGKGILHKNTAARKKSRLTLALNKLAEKA